MFLLSSIFMHIAVVMILLHHSFEQTGFSISGNTETLFSDEVDSWTMVTVLLFLVAFCSSKGPSTVWPWQKSLFSLVSAAIFSQYLLSWVWQQLETLNCGRLLVTSECIPANIEYRSTKITKAIYHANKTFWTSSYDYNLSYQINITYSQLLVLLAYFDNMLNFFLIFSIPFMAHLSGRHFYY